MRFAGVITNGRSGREAGFTLIELLVATTMSIVVVGAATSMLITALKDQPKISQRTQSISTARWVLERLTREIRNGALVDKASSSSVSFQTYIRHTTCGGTTSLASSSPAIKCEVTYSCSATTKSCTRLEAAPGVYTGTASTIFSGIDRSEVFCYVPSTNANPATCGSPTAEPGKSTYIGAMLHIANPSGGSGLTISDGASLSNTILTN